MGWKCGVVGALFVVSECATNSELVQRASFDLNCPPERLRLVELGGDVKGVMGCGNRMTYVEHCEPRLGGVPSCSWVMDGASVARMPSTPMAPPAAPPPMPPR